MKGEKHILGFTVLFIILFLSLSACGGGSTDYNFDKNTQDLNGVIAAPSDLIATSSPTIAKTIVLSWKDNSSNETGFQVEWRDPLISEPFTRLVDSNGRLQVEPANAVASQTTSNGSSGIVLEFRIKAISGSKESAYSNISTAAIP